MNWLSPMKKLIARGVDIRSSWDKLLPHLDTAITGLAVDCVQELILQGADINEKRDEALAPNLHRKQKVHWTPLYAAVRSYIRVDGASSENGVATDASQDSERERVLRIVSLLILAGASTGVLAYDPAAGRPLSFSDRLQSSRDARRRLKGYATSLDLAQDMPNFEARRGLLQALGSS
jgi:hypothetical protein